MTNTFDWNGDGKSDAFDHFMDMKVMSSSSEDSDNSFSDFDDESDTDTDDYRNADIDAGRSELLGTLRNVSTQKSSQTSNTSSSFHDELKQNLRSPEVVRKENEEKKTNRALETAKYDLSKIKSKLIENAKAAKYTVENGVTTVTCIYEDYWQINRYMRTGRLDNGNEIAENQKKFALLRDPNLVYCVWKTFQIEPKYSAEYYQYAAALKQVAAEENIQIEFVVHNNKSGEIYPFPSKVRETYNMTYCQLCVKASTVISGTHNTVQAAPPATSTCSSGSPSTQWQTEASPEKKEPASNGATIAKSFAAIGLCILAFVIMMNVGGIIGALALIGAAILGYKIMK